MPIERKSVGPMAAGEGTGTSHGETSVVTSFCEECAVVGRGDARLGRRAGKLCKDIDQRVNALLDRPIDGDWPYLWLDLPASRSAIADASSKYIRGPYYKWVHQTVPGCPGPVTLDGPGTLTSPSIPMRFAMATCRGSSLA
jgi:hypothetical protein